MARVYLGHTLVESLPEKVDPAATALLIVDMQNDFVRDDGYWGKALGAPMVAGFQSVIEPIGRLADAARQAGVPVIYTAVTQLPDGSLASPVWLADNLRFGYEPLHCMRGTWGWQVIDELAPRPGDVVLDKPRRSAFQGTNLENLLRARSVRTVVAVGVAGSGCVESTVRDGIERDYFMVVARDAIADNNDELTEACRAAYGKLLAPEDFTTTERLIEIWDRPARRDGAG